MKQKIEHNENTVNIANSFYFKCENCGKLILPAGTSANGDKNLCKCDNPIIDETIYINPTKIK